MRLEELKKEFEIVKSNEYCENYSDGGGDGVAGISTEGVANETLAFILPIDINADMWFPSDEEVGKFQEFIELSYLANKLNLNSNYYDKGICFVKNEGEAISKISLESMKRYLLTADINMSNIISHLIDKISEIKESGKKIFYQDRLPWEKRIWDDEFERFERSCGFRKRLGIYICNKNVKVKSDTKN